MNKPDFNRIMEERLEQLSEKQTRQKVLLHSCCAPCSSVCLERIKDYVNPLVYYFNPNLDTEDEFNLRLKEQQRLCEEFNVSCVFEKYDHQEFLSVVKGKENCPEGGSRCADCFYLRLKRTAEKAKAEGILYFATTLTVSPLKNASLINEIGYRCAKEVGDVEYIPTDFKKKGGYLRSIELSKEYSLYRQNYCGCEFSKLER